MPEKQKTSARGIRRRHRAIGATAVFWGIGIGLALLVLGVIVAVDVLMLAFLGLLLAVLLRSLSGLLSRHTGVGERWALALTVLALASLGALTAWFLAPRIMEQIDALRESLPGAIESLRQQIARYETGRWLLDHAPPLGEVLPGRRDLFSRLTGVVSATISALGTIVLVIAIGIYLAAAHETYLRAVVLLAPPAKRPRARDIFRQIGSTLQRWLIGRVISMAIVGVATYIGLLLMGIDLALTLALLAAVLTFVPNFGPIISAVPAVLLGWMVSPMMGVWVAVLYLGIQLVESYVITPMIQQWTLSLPPALTITAQLTLGLLLGGIGLVVATPLTAVAVVLVRELYVRDVLGDETADDHTKREPSDGSGQAARNKS